MKLFLLLFAAGVVGALWCLADLIMAASTITDCHEQNKDTNDL